MIIKSFRAESAAAALKKVRQEMGGDAIVLKTSQLKSAGNRRLVEVTACLDKVSVAEFPSFGRDTAARNAAFSGDATDGDSGLRLEERLAGLDRKLERLIKRSSVADSAADSSISLEQISVLMREAGFPGEYVSSLLDSVVANGNAKSDLQALTREMLTARVSEILHPNLNLQTGDRVIFLGPPGVGKSSMMGKLAAKLVFEDRQKVSLISTDNQKIGAYEEICSYAEVLGASIGECRDADEPLSRQPDAVVLIDTPGVTLAPERLDMLQDIVERSSTTHRIAVFSALMRGTDVARLGEAMKPFRPTHFAMTMFDLTDCYGAVVAGAQALGIKLVFITDAAAGKGELKVPDPARIAELPSDTEVVHE